MKKKSPLFQHIKPAATAIFSFLILITATIGYSNYKKGLWEKDIRANLLDVLIGKKSKLEKALYSRIYYTRGVAGFVALKPDITNEEYYQLANEYIKGDTVIGTMALSKNCVITAIFPMKGHEAAIGLKLLEHPERREIVAKTIETHQTFIAGPVELVEGGTAFISYTPIFENKNSGDGKFWGVTDIVIKERSLLAEAEFFKIENGYEFALRGYNGMGDKGAVFWGNENVFEKNPVSIAIDLPIGSWILAVAPLSGWNQYSNQDKVLSLVLLVSSLVISILIWLFTRALLKIRQNEKELKAILGSMDNLIVEFDTSGKYIKIAPTNQSILYKPEHELIGKTVHQIFEKEKADLFLQEIQKCVSTKQLVVFDYPLDIKGTEYWFTARINYKNSESVIFNVFDVTEKKEVEEIIRKSEIRLRELNEMKDNFFSIVAHDLRNPVSSQKMIIDFLVEDYESMGVSQRLELLTSLQDSASGLSSLLDDLLEWSRSQSVEINVNNQPIKLREFCNNLIVPLSINARLKNIEIQNAIPESALAFSDADMAGTVIRNLISNSIKFTPRGGNIHISSEEYIYENRTFQKINVTDNGIGIKPELIETIFQPGKMVQTTSGTENEKGTGLGLFLCKELVTKLGGQIFVSSIPEQGSTFSFTLPMK